MSDLRGSRAPAKVKFGSGGKFIAALAVILAVSALAAYGYETGQFKAPPKSVVTDGRLPSSSSGSAQ